MKFVEIYPKMLDGHRIRRRSFNLTEYLVLRNGCMFIKNSNEDAENETVHLSFKAILAEDWQVLVDGEWVDHLDTPTTNSSTSCCGNCHDDVEQPETKKLDNVDINLDLIPLGSEGNIFNITVNCKEINIRH